MKPNFLTRRVARVLARWLCEPERAPDLVLTQGGRSVFRDFAYMDRWYLVPRNRLLNVYLHRYHGPDARAPHDHPWWSASMVLRGYVCESVRVVDGSRLGFREHKPGALVVRGPNFIHRIEEVSSNEKAWTLFITGPTVRVWGFWCPTLSEAAGEFVGRRFVAHYDYRVRGCEE